MSTIKINIVSSSEEIYSGEATMVYATGTLGELGIDATVIRTSIIGEELKNKYSLLEWVKSHQDKEIKGFTNHYWNGVTCLQLSKIIEKIMMHKHYWKGVRHMFSPRPVSKYEIVGMINDIYGLNNKIIAHETETMVDKTILSKHNHCAMMNIPDLYTQITELQQYKDLS